MIRFCYVIQKNIRILFQLPVTLLILAAFFQEKLPTFTLILLEDSVVALQRTLF